MSPLDAVYAFEDLGASVLIPTSYGSFPLSYEPMDAPLLWLRQIMRDRGIAECGRATPDDRAQRGCVTILDHGDSAHFRKPPPPAAVRP
jgi:hypothetical protein